MTAPESPEPTRQKPTPQVPAPDTPLRPGQQVSVTVCPDGPLLIRGPAQLRSADGEVIEHRRGVLALCRCGRSRLKPLCDGSHRLNRFRDPATASAVRHVLTHATPVGPEPD